MRFDTKIAIVLREDLLGWQKLNVAAFLASGLAGADADVIGEPYEDGSGRRYLAMFRQPVLVFAGDGEALRRSYERAVARAVPLAIFTDALFATGHDAANRAAVKACSSESLAIAGLAMRAERKTVDKIVSGLAMHG